jgi:energy-coupling factor transporter ATP-binding protein EcfA2
MFLKKFIYINWGNIPNTETEFGPINLFSGGNGSGKTTAADAIQTLMTAAHDNLFHFNPGQDESSQRGRGGKQVRTLASYVLGCDDGAYARPEGCDAYLGAVFYPTPGEDAEVFSALIGMRAQLEGAGQQRVARLEEMQFFIFPGIDLAIGDLLKGDKHGRYLVELDKVYNRLKRQFGSEQIEKYDKKKSYLCRLYGIVRGKSDAVSEREAMNAARAFSRFMAYKPIKGIDEFVANEVLEPRDLGEAIRNVSAMLKRIHAMETDARQVRETVERLAQGRNTAETYINNWLELQLSLYGLARRRYSDCQQRYLSEKHKQQQLREHLAANQQAMALCEERREDLQQQILDINTRRLGIPALRDKDQLLAEKHNLEKEILAAVPQLLSQDQQLQRNIQIADQLLSSLQQTSIELDLPGLADKSLKALLKTVANDSLSLDIHSLLNRDWIDISPLEDKLDSILKQQHQHHQLVDYWLVGENDLGLSLRDQLAQERDRRQRLVEQLQKQMDQAQREIGTLESRQVIYPEYVKRALAILQQQCPEADARVLCDHVEILDPQWQSAIEGYIGAARFGIIVAAEHEAKAIQILRNLPGQNRARVIQGDKARRDLEKLVDLPENSIAHLMQFSHLTAKYYLKASYGQVQRVADAEELRQTRRGITRDCMGSGNYAMFRCDIADTELVFGQGARERALQAKREDLARYTREWEVASDRLNQVLVLLKSVDQLARVSYADILQNLLVTQRRLQNLEQKLQQLDLSSSHSLETELEALKTQDKARQEQHKQLANEQVNIRAQQKNVDEICKMLDAEQEQTLAQVDEAEAAVQAISAQWPAIDSDARLAEIDADLRDISYYEAQIAALKAELKHSLNRLQQCLLQHNQLSRTADGIACELDFYDEFGLENFVRICGLRQEFDALYNRHKNNILAQRHAEIESLQQSFNNAFVTNLCHSIYQAINDGKKILEDLNRELEHHRFGADRERFYFDYQWVPEFKEYWQFFKAVIDNPSLGDGETLFDMPLEPKYQKVREKLMAMLLDEDEQKALRELARIADYRNYRRYEIYKEPEGKPPIALSQYGTGSGGQLETPAYIIRSAAITSAFRFGEGNCHLRMVLVDEAFSKMDEHRSREVINYLTESLGLQLLFIMPSSKSGPFMDLISNQFVFSKCPTAERVGELNSRVLLDRQQCDKEKIAALMANHRRTIRQQAALDFMAEVE